MPKFNFTNITLNDRADITDIMNNFNKIEENGITSTEVDNKISDALADYTTTDNLGSLAKINYSYGTTNPSGGNNGDIYDQYFN